MPGYIQHLYFANLIFKELPLEKQIDKTEFFIGNILPDITKYKNNTHFYERDKLGLLIPNIEIITDTFANTQDMTKFGIYAHLFLDYHYINFLKKNFIFDIKERTMYNPKSGKKTTIRFFFEKIMYNLYTDLNYHLLEKMDELKDIIKLIPENLPRVGISAFDDNRKEKSWKIELQEYLEQENSSFIEDSKEIFNKEDLCEFLHKSVYKFFERSNY